MKRCERPFRQIGTNPDLFYFRIVLATSVAALFFQPLSAAASCRFISISNISFASYNVFFVLPNSGGIGSLTIKCDDTKHAIYEVALSAGQSNHYAVRFMKNGANKLNYNLYTNASRTVVWGNGTGGSSVMRPDINTATMTIYGSIPGGQDAASGLYTDNITASVDF